MLISRRFAYAILAADELVAVTNTVKFRYDDGRTFLNWTVGENVDPAVWMTLFLVLVICINMFPVKVCSYMPPRKNHYIQSLTRSPSILESSNTSLERSNYASLYCSS